MCNLCELIATSATCKWAWWPAGSPDYTTVIMGIFISILTVYMCITYVYGS